MPSNMALTCLSHLKLRIYLLFSRIRLMWLMSTGAKIWMSVRMERMAAANRFEKYPITQHHLPLLRIVLVLSLIGDTRLVW